MKTNVDGHFVIGAMHIKQNMPCQDYVRVGIIGDSSYTIISDGCSSSGETDTGSRILTCTTASILKEYIARGIINPQELPSVVSSGIQSRTRTAAESLGLVREDLHATLLYTLLSQEGGFIHIFGDGCVVLAHLDGSYKTIRTSWKQNMPFYIMYGSDTDMVLFLSNHSNESNESFKVVETTRNTDGLASTNELTLSAQDAVKGYSVPVTKDMLLNLKAIVTFSDGIESFGNSEFPLSALDVITEAIAIKQWNGEFVKRRMSRVLKNFEKNKIRPYDDFSMAAIHINHQNIQP